MQEITISSHFFRSALSKAAERGLPTAQLLAEARISQQLFNQTAVRITATQYAKLQTLTMRALDDEMLGYGSRPIPVGSWSLVCHWLLSCTDIGDALSRLCLCFRLMEKGFKLDLISDSSLTGLRITPWDDSQPEPYAYELFMFGIHRILCWLAKDMIPTREIHLPYRLPQQADEYRVMFPHARVCFDSDRCELVLEASAKTLPIKQKTEDLIEFLHNPMLSIIVNSYNEKSWTVKTQDYLRQHLQEIPTLLEVATEFGIHTKALRKALEKEGISYGDLKSQLRRDVAIQYLTNTDKTIEAIAELIGFSETSTFTRAFKTWTRMTPKQYRHSVS
ncbi:AraC family transcriptional regulator [Maricurvus nonylphenolicus]|uniref:AraC family transcriptional regulator n=1 Tax=Maricurvus nonylphenolicus TaxID=1008307 RepID=UPI0036F2E5BD